MPMRPIGEASDILTPSPDDQIARLSEVAALRQVVDTLNRMGTFMQKLGERQELFTDKLADMHTDITVMKQQDEKIIEIKDRVAKVERRLDAVDLLHAKQEGAGRALTLAKEFTPTLIGLLFFLWAMFSKGVIRLP